MSSRSPHHLVLVLGAMLSLAGCGAPVVGQASPVSTSTPATAESAFSTAPACAVRIPNLVGMTGDEASAALSAVGALGIEFAVNFAPMTNKVISQSPQPGTCQRTTDTVHLTLEPPPPTPHREVSGRDWQLIAKSPDSHRGERIVVFGHVTQFDAVTGASAFRASVDGVRHGRSYDYDTNVILVGQSAEQLANVVQDDMFRAEVTVAGSYSYTTTMGGTLTVPQMQVDKIEVFG